METKVDLHVHSKYSDRPSEWFLRRIGAPESFVEPVELYRSCRERGMDYVTITDHNSISGALEIADRPGTFLSSEVTTYFPDTGSKIHCLVWGITEKWFEDIQEIRPNIFELQKYLRQQNILHAIAHPLFRNNDKLTVEEFEKLILMFERFEGLNGSRHPRACDLANTIFENLTPDLISQMANRHGIEPAGPEPWKKALTGGSDDHSGLYSGHGYTVTPHSPTVFDFLHHLRDGRHKPGGEAGTSTRLAHSLYHITYSYYRSRILRDRAGDGGLVGAMLMKLAGQQAEVSSGLRAVIPPAVTRFFVERRKKKLNDIERMLVDEFTAIRNRGNEMAVGEDTDQDELKFQTACRIGQQLSYAFIQRCIDRIKQGSLIESLQSLSSLGPVLLGMTPYLTAFSAQHKDESFLKSVASRFPGGEKMKQKSGKRAWFTDTFDDINGVAHTIKTIAKIANQNGESITVITSLADCPESDAFPHKNFEPVGKFALPEYESQEVVFPPFLEIFDFVEREEFDELIVSTPGPMGLVALAAARIFNIRVSGIYHTDFPKYIRHLTEDDYLEELTWRYMTWFYGGMDHVYAPSRHYLNQLLDKGFSADRLSVLSRGVDLSHFNPQKRDAAFWTRFGINGGFKFLYVGRVSKEKNLESLLRAFSLYSHEDPRSQMVVVGNGPHLEELQKTYGGENVIFTGYLHGEELAKAYASSDIFVFPSMTDTFGNAVLEAHASGLPAIVSEHGGPAEIVESHRSGLITDTRDPQALVAAMRKLRMDEGVRAEMSRCALARAREGRWEFALQQLQ